MTPIVASRRMRLDSIAGFMQSLATRHAAKRVNVNASAETSGRRGLPESVQSALFPMTGPTAMSVQSVIQEILLLVVGSVMICMTATSAGQRCHLLTGRIASVLVTICGSTISRTPGSNATNARRATTRLITALLVQ